MSNEPPRAFNKKENITAEVIIIDWHTESVCVGYRDHEGEVVAGVFWDFDECEIIPYVCPDKNGDKVFAGDRAKVADCEGKVDRLGGICIESEDGHLHHVWPSQIELIESKRPTHANSR